MNQSITVTPETDDIDIPSYLIRETIDGIPFYYQDYQEVLYQQKKLEDIL